MATKAQWQAALRAVKYSNSSDNPTTTQRSVTFEVNDGTANSNTFTSTINITAVNAAPVITTNSLLIGQGETVVLSSSNVNATDPHNTPAQLT